MSHSAHDLKAVIDRVSAFLDDGCLPYVPDEEDSTDDLLALRVAIKGVNVPRGEPSGGLIAALKELCVGLEAELNLRMDQEISEVGDFVVERKPASYKHTWDHIGAISEVATKAVFEEAVTHDGETPTAARTAQVVADAIVRLAGISYWRVQEGDRRGIPLRKFKHSTGDVSSPAGVLVRRRDKAEDAA